MASPAQILSLAPADLEALRSDLRDGRSFVATFRGPGGIAAVEVMGPRGMRPAGDYLAAPVRTLRLWVTGRPHAPEAVATLGQDFEAGLRAIEERARRHVDPEAMPALAALLHEVRSALARPRPRVPSVGRDVTEAGVPSFRAWASCIPLGDLEAALQKAVA